MLCLQYFVFQFHTNRLNHSKNARNIWEASNNLSILYNTYPCCHKSEALMVIVFKYNHAFCPDVSSWRSIVISCNEAWNECTGLLFTCWAFCQVLEGHMFFDTPKRLTGGAYLCSENNINRSLTAVVHTISMINWCYVICRFYPLIHSVYYCWLWPFNRDILISFTKLTLSFITVKGLHKNNFGLTHIRKSADAYKICPKK